MKTRQIVILAAGKSSRFYPFSDESHKSMFMICGKPIIGWTLQGLKQNGINEVVVVVGREDHKLINYLSTYSDMHIKIIYQNKPQGMGDALLSAKEILEESFVLGFPHFVNKKVFAAMVRENVSDKQIKILVDETEEPWKYGILEFNNNRPVGIIEKPGRGKEPSNIRASGCYLLNKKFINILQKQKHSEYMFETSLDYYMKNFETGVIKADFKILPCKYAWDLAPIKDYILENMPNHISRKAKIAKTSVIRGKVIIEDGAVISDFSLIEGPVYVGKNAIVGSYCILRDGSVLGENTQIERYTDCVRSIIGDNSHIHSGFIGDSILGQFDRIGAGFVTANKRLDRKVISSVINDCKVSTASNSSGCLIGNNVKIGVNASTMPGVTIGSGAVIGPGSVVMKNVDKNSSFFQGSKPNKNE